MIRHLVILGATGDLTARYLGPALAQLQQRRSLPEGFRVTGIARDQWDNDAFRRHISQRLSQAVSDVDAARQALAPMLSYRQADVTEASNLEAALGQLDEPVAAYLALPPFLFAPAIKALSALGLPHGSRVAVEKPFGHDLRSAKALNALAHRAFPEDAIFRLDHFLGKQTVQNILGLRFANRIFEPLWNNLHLARVEITWDETLTMEGRASYDRVGALRDMIQNHLLQILCLVAMEPPTATGPRDLRDRKVDALRATRRLSMEEVARCTRRGRYVAGRIGSREVPAYVDEPGVDPERNTETFAEVTLLIDNWRWAGVPFVLRSGKSLERDRRHVTIHLKPTPHLAFGPSEEPQPNVLRLELSPDRLALGVNINRADDLRRLKTVELSKDLASQEPMEYARLLLDILEGDSTLSIRDDEVEESWRIIDPILEGWEQNRVPLQEYPAGSSGPPQP